MRSLLAISLMLVCFADKGYATFAEFMNNLPSEIGNAFSIAWSSISDAIKKPVRIKRLGQGGKHKSTVKTTELYESEPYFRHTSESPSQETATVRHGNRVTIPVFPTPKFKTLDDWRSMQKAYYAKKKIDTETENKGPVLVYVEPPYTKTKKSKSKTQSDSFATMMVF